MKKHWQDWGNVVLGVWIFASPWILKYAATTGADVTGVAANNQAIWNLYIVGIVVVALAAAALYAFQVWEEWTNLALGVWLVVSPWALGFSSSEVLMWNAVIAGILVVVLAGWAIAPPQDSSKGSAKKA